MFEAIIDLPVVKTLGWGGMISLLGIIIPLIWRLNPITTLTSTKFERILFSKEKRLWVRFFFDIGIVLLSIFYSIIFFVFYLALFTENNFNSSKSKATIL
ncbi:hypothetical protein, partial [Paenibacillus ihuae]|uniref:hypothetical protein n=1 Tax=Paenibacillus ihuae TaxID=1232431 RepID=UPI003CC909AD